MRYVCFDKVVGSELHNSLNRKTNLPDPNIDKINSQKHDLKQQSKESSADQTVRFAKTSNIERLQKL